MIKKLGFGAIFILLLVLCLSITTLFADQGVVVPAAKNLLQYRAGGHILGFMPDKVYFASVDHALSIEFIGGSGNGPLEINPGGTGDDKGPKNLGRMEYRNLWPGITLRYDKADRGIVESTYLVEAGADVKNIRLKYNVPVTLRDDGTLKFGFRSGNLTVSAPVAWQEIDGKRQSVNVAFSSKDGTVGFSVGKYNRTYPLIIDPYYQYEPTYQWHTFYGAPVFATGIAIDGSGNVYVTGTSYTSWGAPLNAFDGNSDCPNFFVLKLNSSGAYQWNTFYGSGVGDEGDFATGIAIDVSGNVYVTGYSYNQWYGPADQSPLHPFGTPAASLLFVLKLNSSGAYQWHTFYGNGAGTGDVANGIAVDPNSVSGNVSVTGYSVGSWSGPAPTNNAPLNPFVSTTAGASNIFILTLNSNGAYQWHTFYGSGSTVFSDEAWGIAIDSASGNISVTGQSNAVWYGPAGQQSLNNNFSFGTDDFVLTLNSSGAYQWHTFYGSGYGNDAYAVAIDRSGNVYVTGTSFPAWNGPINVAYPEGIPPLNSPSDFDSGEVVVLKLNSSGAYQWHTFYGPYIVGELDQIAINSSGDISVTGTSNTAWNGPAGQLPANPYDGGASGVASNAFILTLNNTGAYQWHSFYGSGIGDEAEGVAIDGSGNTYVTGYSSATWNVPNTPAGTPPLNDFNARDQNMFVLKLSLNVCAQTAIQLDGTTYTSLQNAYAAAITGDTIQMQALALLIGPMTLNNNISVTLQGGFECGYMSNPGFTNLSGSLTIGGSSGPVTIQNVIISSVPFL
ncbi:MAG: SBBP repeat-containing protein [Dissulfurispiraceae bacterium]